MSMITFEFKGTTRGGQEAVFECSRCGVLLCGVEACEEHHGWHVQIDADPESSDYDIRAALRAREGRIRGRLAALAQDSEQRGQGDHADLDEQHDRLGGIHAEGSTRQVRGGYPRAPGKEVMSKAREVT